MKISLPDARPGAVTATGGLLPPTDAEAPILQGWVLPDPLDPTAESEVALDIAGFGTRLVLAEVPAGPDDRLPPGARLFAWPIPSGLRLPAALRAWDLATGLELAGSPVTLLPEGEEAGQRPDRAAPLQHWPGGVAGQVVATTPIELAFGLWVAVQPPAHTLRYELHVQPSKGDDPPRRGIRLVTEATSPRISVHMRPIDPLPPAGVTVEVQVPAWLPEATEVAMQAFGEIWLTRRDEDGFTPLRRLRRTRLFRRQGTATAELLLLEEEAAQADRLWITVGVLDARGLTVLPPRLDASGATDQSRMEDARLETSFDALRGISRLHAGVDDDQRLLPPTDTVMTVPAAPRQPWHPFTQVVVPVYNGDAVVCDCLRALRDAATGPMEVLVVDDGSRALTAEALREQVSGDPRFVLHRRDINRGYTKSINEGVMLTRADWVVILNSDTLVPHGWLDKLHAAAQARPGTGMVGPLSNAATWQSIPEAKNLVGGWSTNDLIEPQDLERIQALLATVTERAYPDFPLLNGFCTLIARAVFDRIGLYDEDAFPMGYGEETDLCLRARQAGFRLIVADDCFVYHHKSISFGSVNRSRLTRAGGFEMRNKHIGVNIAAMEYAMAASPPMQRLRARMTDLFAVKG